MRMPMMNEYQTTRRIRAWAGGDSAKIVALAASAFQEDREEFLKAGCDDILSKPLDETKLFSLMGESLGLRYRYNDQSAEEAALCRVREAAERLDIEGVQAIADGMMATYPGQARKTAEWLKNFRFDKIIELCRSSEE